MIIENKWSILFGKIECSLPSNLFLDAMNIPIEGL